MTKSIEVAGISGDVLTLAQCFDAAKLLYGHTAPGSTADQLENTIDALDKEIAKHRADSVALVLWRMRYLDEVLQDEVGRPSDWAKGMSATILADLEHLERWQAKPYTDKY